jgi:hypothetical protein
MVEIRAQAMSVKKRFRLGILFLFKLRRTATQLVWTRINENIEKFELPNMFERYVNIPEISDGARTMRLQLFRAPDGMYDLLLHPL